MKFSEIQVNSKEKFKRKFQKIQLINIKRMKNNVNFRKIQKNSNIEMNLKNAQQLKSIQKNSKNEQKLN